jgi:hypothetical protein
MDKARMAVIALRLGFRVFRVLWRIGWHGLAIRFLRWLITVQEQVFKELEE